MPTDPGKYLVQGSYNVLTLDSGTSFPWKFLKQALPDVQTAMFFAKVYDLTPNELSTLLVEVFPTDVTDAFVRQAGMHSQTLQDFLVEEFWDGDRWVYDIAGPEDGEVTSPEPVNAEILPELWKQIELDVAKSIADVAHKLKDTVAKMPGRTGEMVFRQLATVNAKRPTIGDYKASIRHQQQKQVLVVFDVSGSMSEETVRTVVDDVVGLAYESNASLAIVSNTCSFWEPGTYDTKAVLDAAEYAGTHYETLAPLFTGRNWDVVVTVADYDSAVSAKHVLAACDSKIGQLLDISLVSRSTFLAECLGQLADEVRPLMIAEPYAQLCW